MANLLPIEIKKKYRKEFVQRTVVGWLCMTASIFLIVAVLLFPTYILLKAEHKTLSVALSTNQEQEEVQVDEIVSVMSSYVGLLQQDTYERQVPYGLFAHLYKNKSENIDFTRMAYSNADNTVNLTGVAATRKDLFDFYSQFDDDQIFRTVSDYPFESLGQASDIQFSIELKIRDEHENKE